MADERNLYISGDLTPERVRYIKEAKARIDPGWFTRLEAYSEGTHAPLIAFQVPPILPLSPWAWCAQIDSSARMENALRELWGISEPKHLWGEGEWLSKVMGCNVKRIE